MLFAFFGLGLPEIIILGILCAVPVAALAIILPIVFLMDSGSSPSERKDRQETHDIGDDE